MSEKDPKDPAADVVDREIEAASGELASLPPEQAEALKEKVRRRVREEMEAELRARTEAERKEAARLERERRAREKELEKGETFERFNRNFRFQHMVLFSSVIILIVTGMPLKFPEFFLSGWLIGLFGGIQASTIVHRVGAAMLIYFMVHHFLYTILSRDGRRDFLLLLPKLQDAKDIRANIRHFLGKSPEKPKFGRFSYIEKFDYWAVYWGCVIMIGSGAFLWFETVIMKFLPKVAIDMAHEMHSDEALLATLAIVVWHFYNVHFNPDRFPGSLMWWHGRITEHEIKEEHPLEYEEIMERRRREAREGAGE
ncbi:MAG: cytochrome b/b6 domain-containing protein [Thermodesulfobacteriota bacterium]